MRLFAQAALLREPLQSERDSSFSIAHKGKIYNEFENESEQRKEGAAGDCSVLDLWGS